MLNFKRSASLMARTLLACALLASCSSVAQAAPVPFSFSLPAAATTSAGAYSSDGTLVRTLWRKRAYPSGTTNEAWDGLDDAGVAVGSGNYIIKVLHHNVSYTWEGVIGNTSTNSTGNTVHRSFLPVAGVAVAGSKIWMASGYNEQQPLWRTMNTASPNTVSTWGRNDYQRNFRFITTDGTNVYHANIGNSFNRTSFVVANKVGDNSEVAFASGVSEGAGGNLWSSVIDRESAQGSEATGLGVQTGGSYLFVSHGALNMVREFNKTSGALVRSIAVTSPSAIACGSNYFWVAAKEGGVPVVRRYNVAADGSTTLGAVIKGLVNPLALALSPGGGTLLVADGGTSKQVKGFSNPSKGIPTNQWTLGSLGGYNATNGPAVTNSKFLFRFLRTDISFPAEQTYMATQGTSASWSFWLGDPGNERNLQFSSARSLLDKVAYLPANYMMSNCDGDPTRVFIQGWLEYNVDYAQTPKAGAVLVRNWSAGLPNGYLGDFNGLRNVYKASNGRTYALAFNNLNNQSQVLELASTGIRDTGITLPSDATGLNSDMTMQDDGSLRYRSYVGGWGGTDIAIYKRDLDGFDASGNPQWAAATVLASAPGAAPNPVTDGWPGPKGPQFPTTSSNIVVTSNSSKNNVFHLGGMNVGGTKWLWRAVPNARYYDGTGVYSPNANYPANNHNVEGRNIVFGCHGEGYSDETGSEGQANKFLHYFDDGLFVGEFGELNINRAQDTVTAGVAGNSFSHALVRVGNSSYFWHNDESHAGGVHRWKINNPDSPTEIIARVSVGEALPDAPVGASSGVAAYHAPDESVGVMVSETSSKSAASSNGRIAAPALTNRMANSQED